MSVRPRLTLLYAGLFLLSGAALLAFTYLLVAHGGTSSTAGERSLTPSGGETVTTIVTTGVLHGEVRRQLLVRSGVALAVMAGVSAGLGWVVAGRVLRPLQVMTGRLATALDSHKRFVANAAHELRTPLTLEHALLEEAVLDPGTTAATFRARFAELMAVSEQKALLLESLLVLATSERGLDRREPVDLAALTADVLRATGTGLRVAADLRPARAIGDPVLIERLLANLIDNAVSHNVPGGLIEVATAGTLLTVRNTGPVVPPGMQDQILHPFQRLSRTADDRHHGLGLSIVQAIAGAHGADLRVRARPEGGLAVQVRFVAVV
jgi:signal transduction histidine kinase